MNTQNRKLYYNKLDLNIIPLLIILIFTQCNSHTHTNQLKDDSKVEVKQVADTASIQKKLLGPVMLGGKGSPKLPKMDYNNLNYDSIFTKVEVLPEPPGGMKAFREWMTNNYILPAGASKSQSVGSVLLSFIVEKNGSLTNFEVEVVRGFSSSLQDSIAQAGIVLLKKSKKWSPGIITGRPVRARYVLPIRIDASKILTKN